MFNVRQLRRGAGMINSTMREMGQKTPFIATTSHNFFASEPTAEYVMQPIRQFSTSEAISDDPVDIESMSNEELADASTIPGWEFVHNPPREQPRGALVGTVVSDKMTKTLNVEVNRYQIVPKYRKRRRYTRKFMAHDENEVANVGDLVMIVPCHRISKHKHFMLREIIKEKGQL